MAKGKKLDNETIYKIMLSYAVTRNYSETSRNLGVPESTVRKIVSDNKDDKNFAILCGKKRDEFVEKANKIIDKATNLLEKRLDTALEKQEELEEILSDTLALDNKILNDSEKKALAKRINKLQINGLSEITTAIGTMYDKRALASGESTNNEKLTINIELTDDE